MLPGPTEGSWSASPTRINLALWAGSQEAPCEGEIDHRRLIDDDDVCVERVAFVSLKARRALLASGVLEEPVERAGLLSSRLLQTLGRSPRRAAEEVGSLCPSSAATIAQRRRLPVPGPPVITSTPRPGLARLGDGPASASVG